MLIKNMFGLSNLHEWRKRKSNYKTVENIIDGVLLKK